MNCGKERGRVGDDSYTQRAKDPEERAEACGAERARERGLSAR